jgi:hypothetical protein
MHRVKARLPVDLGTKKDDRIAVFAPGEAPATTLFPQADLRER